MIRVGIVEDHDNELQGIVRDLARASDITVCVTAGNVQEAGARR